LWRGGSCKLVQLLVLETRLLRVRVPPALPKFQRTIMTKIINLDIFAVSLHRTLVEDGFDKEDVQSITQDVIASLVVSQIDEDLPRNDEEFQTQLQEIAEIVK
jgi:hypothetical protein